MSNVVTNVSRGCRVFFFQMLSQTFHVGVVYFCIFFSDVVTNVSRGCRVFFSSDVVTNVSRECFKIKKASCPLLIERSGREIGEVLS